MTSKEFRERLGRRARKAGVVLTADLVQWLECYYQLLSLWNRRVNLTALKLDEGGDEVFDRLLIEPLSATRFLPPRAASLVDIGSGGGSPAIPMKLAVPSLGLTMVEAKTRKCAFLREAIRQLDLFATVVETARYEELLARPDLHERADVVTARAVRIETRTLLSVQAFLKPGGSVFLFRGGAGPDVPSAVPPPLVWIATHPLVDATHAKLVVLQKL